MARVGDSYCWLIADDPTVCPYLGPQEAHLLADVRRRNREKCLGCEELRRDLADLRRTGGPLFEALTTILEEALNQCRPILRTLQIKDELLDILRHLSHSLQLALDPEEILYKGLVAFTAGGSLGFNRGFALLVEGGELRGYFALGPRDGEEAARIWQEVSAHGVTLADLLRYSPEVFAREREKFRAWLERFRFALTDPPFGEVFSLPLPRAPEAGRVVEVGPEKPLPELLRQFYGPVTFWIVPLISHDERPLGALLLDNFLTGRPISTEDRLAMELFALEIAVALERGLAYAALREKVEMLEDAYRRIREHQQTIIRLREEAAIGEMVLQLTHTIKNPVVAIGGLARHLHKKLEAHSPCRRFADAIAQEASRLEEILQDFVRFASLRYAVERHPVNVNEILDLLVHEKREATRHGPPIEWHVDLAPVPPILADERQLYNCLENIVNNALEAMSEGGALFIESRRSDGAILIVVRDTGPGLSEEAARHLFKPFFTTKPTGSGLGLYTSKQIVESLGGELTLSCQLGQGCEVVIRLPIPEFASEVQAGSESARAEPSEESREG
ncbi:Sporulation kinase E [bacterium HR10]|nr:Sporulation kinase E [bacterium HR10]